MSIRLLLPICLTVLLVAFLAACGQVDVAEPAKTPTSTQSSAEIVEVSEPTTLPTAAPTATPTATSTPEPTATSAPTPTPTAVPEPTPTPEPEPITARPVTTVECCGLFTWLDAERLLVFDRPLDAENGSWIIHLADDTRSFFSPGFGVTSGEEIFAMIEPGEQDLMVRDGNGHLVSRLRTEGAPGWPSPDGAQIAWLEPLPVRTPSSSVHRSVRLKMASLESGATRTVLEFQASELIWIPDNRHIVAAARSIDFETPGVWKIDTLTGDYEVIHQETFLRSLRLSPDGRYVSFMRLFNEEPDENGLWVLDIETGQRSRIFESGSHRWDADSRHIWCLNLAPTGFGGDRLERYDIQTGDIIEVVELEGQVLNETWSISPSGATVAYWRLADGLVVVEPLR